MPLCSKLTAVSALHDIDKNRSLLNYIWCHFQWRLLMHSRVKMLLRVPVWRTWPPLDLSLWCFVYSPFSRKSLEVLYCPMFWINVACNSLYWLSCLFVIVCSENVVINCTHWVLLEGDLALINPSAVPSNKCYLNDVLFQPMAKCCTWLVPSDLFAVVRLSYNFLQENSVDKLL